MAKGARALLLTAERLFGKFGLDGVSLRQIVASAGQANVSAVHHHFGSKTGLIQAAYEMRTTVVEAARQAKIEAMDRDDRHTIEDVLASLLMPIVEALPDKERMLYARFMMRLLPLSETEHPYFKALHICGPSEELIKRMKFCLPHLPSDVLVTRVRMGASIFLQGIWDEPRVRALASDPYPTPEMYWDEILQMSLSVFLNAYPPARRFRPRVALRAIPA
jgi:AcrR family transcriptional regulator